MSKGFWLALYTLFAAPLLLNAQQCDSVAVIITSAPAICPGDSVLLSVDGPGEVIWSGTDTVDVFWVSEPGIVEVQVSQGNCVSFGSVELIEGAIPVLPVLEDYSVCAGDGVTWASEGWDEAVDWSWYNSNTGIGLDASGDGLPPDFTGVNDSELEIVGVVTIEGTSDLGCQASNLVQVSVFPVPVIQPQSLPTYCSGANDVIPLGLEMALDGIEWSLGLEEGDVLEQVSLSGEDLTVDLINGDVGTVAVGTVQLIASTAMCSSDQEFVFEVAALPEIDPVADVLVCSGDLVESISFDGVGSSMLSFNWSGGDAVSGMPDSGAGIIGSFVATGSDFEVAVDVVSVTGEDEFGCMSTIEFEVAVSPSPILTEVSSMTVCSGEAVEVGFELQNDALDVEWGWSYDDLATGLEASGSGNGVEFVAANLSTVSSSEVVFWAETELCADTSAFGVEVRPLPVLDDLADVQACVGEVVDVPSFSADAVFPVSFAWSATGDDVGQPESGSGQFPTFTATLTGLSAGSTTLQVVATAGGCASDPEQALITVSPTPFVDLTVSAFELCSGESFNYTPENGLDGIIPFETEYSWIESSSNHVTIGPNVSGESVNLGQVVNSLNQLGSIELTVTPVTGGCVGEDFSIEISLYPALQMVSSSAQSICLGEEVGLFVDEPDGVETMTDWTPSEGLSITFGNVVIASPETSTAYTAETVDLTTGCLYQNVIEVEVNEPAVGSLQANGPLSLCEGDTLNLQVISESGTALWNNGAVGTGLDVTSTGAYGCVLVQGACETQLGPLTVEFFSLPEVVLSGPTSFCSGQEVVFEANSNGGLPVWSLNGLVVQTGGQEFSLQGASGDMTVAVEVSGMGGCAAGSTIEVSGLQSPDGFLPDQLSICEGSSVLLVAPEGIVGAQWSGLVEVDGDTALVQSEFGQLIFTGSGDNGCPLVDSSFVAVVSPDIPVLFGELEVCGGGVYAYQVSPAGGWSVDDWSVQGGDISGSDGSSIEIVWNPQDSVQGIVASLTHIESGCIGNVSVDVLLSGIIPEAPNVNSIADGVFVLNAAYPFMYWGYSHPITGETVYVLEGSQVCSYPDYDPLNWIYWVEVGNDQGCIYRQELNEPILTDVMEKDDEGVVIWPNPSSTDCRIQVAVQDLDKAWLLRDSSGRKLMSGTVSSQDFSIPLCGLTAGSFYFCLMEVASRQRCFPIMVQ